MFTQIHILKLRRIGGRGNLRATADAQITFVTGTGSLPVVLHGCRVIQKQGERAYVALPQVETADGRFFAAVTGPKELREAVQAAVLSAWTAQEAAR